MCIASQLRTVCGKDGLSPVFPLFHVGVKQVMMRMVEPFLVSLTFFCILHWRWGESFMCVVVCYYHHVLDPLKNGVLAVQTVRNNIMASTVLATMAITLTSLIGVFVGIPTSSSTPPSPSSLLVYGNKAPLASSIKFFSISLCFMVAFLCNIQSIRYYAHVSFLVVVPPRQGEAHLFDTYVARNLNRGSFFWSLGLRAFYVSFVLFLWIFGPMPMFASSCVMVCLLYFLDRTTESTRQHHETVNVREEMKEDVV